MILEHVSFIAVWFFIVSFSILTPLGLHQAIQFGVSIPIEHKDHHVIRAARRMFILLSLLSGILLAFICFIFDLFEIASIMNATAIFAPIYLPIQFLLYLKGYHRVKELKTKQGWEIPVRQIISIDTSFRNKLGHFRSFYLLHFLLITINVVVIWWYYDNIPDKLILHYDFSGQADRFGSKSVGVVFMTNLFQLIMVFISITTQEAIIRSKQKINPLSPEVSSKKGSFSRFKVSLGLQLVTIFIIVLFTLVQGSIIEIIKPAVVVILFFLAVIIIAVISVILKYKEENAVNDTFQEPNLFLSEADHYWKWGLFYVNPNDPSVLVEKRVGLGWTVNFGHRLGWVILLTPLFLVVLIIFFTFI